MTRSESTTAKNKNWTSRSMGSYWQHQCFYLLIRCGGRQAAYLLLYLVVFYYTLWPSVRRKSAYYLDRRFPQVGLLRRFQNSYRLNLELGKVLVDRALVGILGPQQLNVNFCGKKDLLDLVAEGRGVILVNAHVGCWQVATSALGFIDTPVSLLMQREEGDIDRHYFEHSDAVCPYRIIDPRGDLGGVLEMMEVLTRGEVLSVMGDRMLGGQRNGVDVSFLGGKVKLPYSAYKLASATGAPILTLFSYKTGPDSYEMKIFQTIKVPQGLGRGKDKFTPYVQEFAAALETFCQEHPFQFFNFFDLWRDHSYQQS